MTTLEVCGQLLPSVKPTGYLVEVTRTSDLVAENVKRVRRARGWSAQRLAEECATLGAPELSAAVIANIETGRRDRATGLRRRDVSLDEWLVFAAALNVSPSDLLLLAEGPELVAPPVVNVTDELTVDVTELRGWLNGTRPVPPDRDLADFLRHAPAAHRLEMTIARHPAWRASEVLRGLLAPACGEDDRDAALAALLRRALVKLTRRVEDLADDLEERTGSAGADRG